MASQLRWTSKSVDLYDGMRRHLRAIETATMIKDVRSILDRLSTNVISRSVTRILYKEKQHGDDVDDDNGNYDRFNDVHTMSLNAACLGRVVCDVDVERNCCQTQTRGTSCCH